MSTSVPEKKLSLTHMKIIISFMVVFKIVIINYESLMLELFYVQWETWWHFECIVLHKLKRSSNG